MRPQILKTPGSLPSQSPLFPFLMLLVLAATTALAVPVSIYRPPVSADSTSLRMRPSGSFSNIPGTSSTHDRSPFRFGALGNLMNLPAPDVSPTSGLAYARKPGSKLLLGSGSSNAEYESDLGVTMREALRKLIGEQAAQTIYESGKEKQKGGWEKERWRALIGAARRKLMAAQ